jgi:hypothetical protein
VSSERSAKTKSAGSIVEPGQSIFAFRQFAKAPPLVRRSNGNRCSHRIRRSGNRSHRNGSRGNPGTRNLGTRNHRNGNPTPAHD